MSYGSHWVFKGINIFDAMLCLMKILQKVNNTFVFSTLECQSIPQILQVCIAEHLCFFQTKSFFVGDSKWSNFVWVSLSYLRSLTSSMVCTFLMWTLSEVNKVLVLETCEAKVFLIINKFLLQTIYPKFT